MIFDLLTVTLHCGLGGASSLSREERNGAKEGVHKDSETEQRVLKKRKKEKRVQNSYRSAEEELGSLFGDGVTGKLPRFANKITLKVCFLSSCCSLLISNMFAKFSLYNTLF